MEAAPDAQTWLSLTVIDEKRQLFADETYFRESWAAAGEALGPNTLSVVQSVAVLVIQPDCIASRKVETCLDYFAAHEFTPVMIEPVQFNRHHIRELWRYQMPISTLDSITLAELVCTKTQSLLVFFADLVAEPEVPASTRMTPLKGSAREEKRRPNTLRSVLECPNPNIVLVHASDEPVDVVRELGILFDHETLVDLYGRLARGLADLVPADTVTPVADVYRQCPANRMSPSSSMATLLAQLDAAEATTASQAHQVKDALRDAQAGRHLDWFAFSRQLDSLGIDNRSWDALVFGAHHIRHSRPDTRHTIDSSGLSRWYEGAGRMVNKGFVGSNRPAEHTAGPA